MIVKPNNQTDIQHCIFIGTRFTNTGGKAVAWCVLEIRKWASERKGGQKI